ncbi:TonB-dependent receptor [Chitinophagaceae bacterium LB-8]|uniref:TonB-dependent receptor n=1 Tax=Paraflavisolibacter caeni TaxID=2982496 RepID=A0A9X2Y0Y8_9BACT|nr:TonB-dependent receptor [Paraflavisolibacter caeni]MCU7552691.1 TonB-dependent receptor [Paraflavisolibacter caeni]
MKQKSKHIYTHSQRSSLLFLFSFFFLASVYAQKENITLTGKVIDEATKQPLSGATVHIKGTTHEVITDDRGVFGFLTGQRLPVTYIVSYVGYQTSEVTLKEGSSIEVVLRQANSQLTDVLVVGYGRQRRSDVTGSIATVSSKALQQPSSSLDQTLKGAAAGVQVTQTSGQPGGGVSIRIRGGSSIQGGNEPLYVIDGFPIYNSASSAGAITGATVNPLSGINPADIESINILKDASATAIYGSRGANGVIIVTTKKGKSDRNQITYDASYGVQSLRKKIALLDAKGFAALRNDALYDTDPSKGKYQYLTEEQISQLGKGTDWQDEAFQKAPVQNHQLTISGGNAKTRYAVSGNYFNQDGIIKNTDFQRLSGRANLDVVASNRLKISSNFTASRTDANVAPNGIVSALLTMPPTATIYEPDGSYTLRNPFENIFSNPIAALNEQKNKTTTNRLFGTASGEYTILNGLELKVLLGTDVSNTKESSYIPSTIYEGASTNGAASSGAINTISWLNENTLSYSKKFSRHTIDALGGFTQQEFQRDIIRAGAQQFVTDDLEDNSLQSGATVVKPYSDNTRWVLHSFLGRVNYNFDQKYFLTASLRADGSSRFGKGNKWGYFPSAALSWKLSSEPFFDHLLPVINDLKLRASFGTTGNLEIGEYQSLSTLTSLTYLFGNTIVTGFTPNRLANSELGWETTYQYDAGVDVGLFHNRLTLTLDGYYKKTKDLLLNVEIPWTTGQPSSLQNFGSVQNKGFELGLNSRNFTGAFQWNTGINASINRNEVLSIGNGAQQYISGNYIIQVGQPLGLFYGTVTDGILQSHEVSEKGKYTGSAAPKGGDRLYKDINGDGTFTTAADRAIIGSAQPDIIYGISNDFSWKGFDLSIFFQGSEGNKILNSNKQTLELFTGQQNASAAALDRWTTTNPSNTIPRAKLDPAPVFSDRFIEDGSFVRLKTLTIGYSVPRALLQKVKLSNLRFYLIGQNLFTWTKYTGFDPEVTSGNNVSPGTDAGIYPISKVINAGVTVNF